ncbi:MAG: hypothetical protein ILP22_07510 [Oscillospiraceae bacterium]|nr:hypothetical protein [Oscillospiraceae bacterium]
MKKLNDNSYIVILGWMVSDLELSGDLLLAYAWLYNRFRMNDTDWEFLTYENLSLWFNSDYARAREIVQELEDKELITAQHYYDEATDDNWVTIKINSPHK